MLFEKIKNITKSWLFMNEISGHEDQVIAQNARETFNSEKSKVNEKIFSQSDGLENLSVKSKINLDLIINSNKILKFIIAIAVLIVFLSILANLYKFTFGHDRYLVRLFDLDSEWNSPTFFTSILCFLCFFLLLTIFILKRKTNDIFFVHWLILALSFFYISVDEMLSFHEQLIIPTRSLLNLSGIFYFSWVLPAILILLILFIFYLPFIIKLPKRHKIHFILAGIIYVSGALGCELLGGYYAEINGTENIAYSLINNIEETMEIAGIIIFLYALFDYMRDYFGDLKIILSK